ncbi:MAG: hypothetical protein IPJ65_42975 [Archangiaceae bacterium]|nr:hypothetical protein [Archangiaceae bacterium]
MTTDKKPQEGPQLPAIRTNGAETGRGSGRLDLAAIKARCEAATPGPWFTAGEADTLADQKFIAAARTDVPALCDEVDRLRRELAASKAREAKLREALSGIVEAWEADEIGQVDGDFIHRAHTTLATPADDSALTEACRQSFDDGYAEATSSVYQVVASVLGLAMVDSVGSSVADKFRAALREFGLKVLRYAQELDGPVLAYETVVDAVLRGTGS